MALKLGLRKKLNNLLDYRTQRRSFRGEYKKFEDPRRRAIWETVTFTEEQMRRIDELYVSTYGKKIPYTWHRHFTAFTGRFDERYIPESLYIPRFEYYINSERHFVQTFSDKNMLALLASQAPDVVLPETYLRCVAGMYQDSDNTPLTREDMIVALSNMGEAFCKPTTDSCSGRGCVVIDMQNGVEQKTQRTAAELLDSLGDNFVIQERLRCHSQVALLHPNSCNTFRIITYRWKDDFYCMPHCMRIGRHGNNVDNAHAGGMFIAISDSGVLHKTAFTEFRETFDIHPDSGIAFGGYCIDGFPKCLEAALALHRAIPQVGAINWDFTLNEENMPVLIEANMHSGGIWLAQMAHGCGVFGERTEEILRWIGKMEKLKPDERRKYAFGKE